MERWKESKESKQLLVRERGLNIMKKETRGLSSPAHLEDELFGNALDTQHQVKKKRDLDKVKSVCQVLLREN